MIDLNVMGCAYIRPCCDALPAQIRQGQYVVTGSSRGTTPHFQGGQLWRDKFFIHGFAGNLADENGRMGRALQVVSPGMVDTPFFDEAQGPIKLQSPEACRNCRIARAGRHRPMRRSATI